ncbi:MAG: hypothetical protein IPH63_05825 [Flavobacteriales bacterium]|nr:hypothetical protein [Flavobacteriales bacterium]
MGQDCNGDFGGTAFIDNCATCVGATPVKQRSRRNGDLGTASRQLRNLGGNTGEVAVADRNGTSAEQHSSTTAQPAWVATPVKHLVSKTATVTWRNSIHRQLRNLRGRQHR